MRIVKVFAIGLVCVLSLGSRVTGETGISPRDWPSWRGPTSNGVAHIAAKPPLKWDDNTNIRWKVELPGPGSATPIVIGDQVIVLTATKTDKLAKPEELPPRDSRFETKTKAPDQFYRFEVQSFARETGKLLWTRSVKQAVPHEGHHATHSYAGGSPATDGKRIYASFGSFGVYALDLSGKILWSRDLGRLNTRLGWGEAVSPVVSGDSVVLNWDQEADSSLIVLDAATGKTRWQSKRNEKSTWCTPLIVEHKGQFQVIVNGTNRIRSYDLADGKVLWEVSGMTANPIPSPVAGDGVAYVMSGYRGSAAMAVSLDAKGEAENMVLWKHAKGTPYVPSPILFGDRLYFTQVNSQMLTVLDAKSGKPLLEGERLPGVSSFYSSPAIANNRIYLVDRGGTTLVLSAEDKPKVLATNRLSDRIDASPALSGEMLFLRGEKYLHAIAEKKD